MKTLPPPPKPSPGSRRRPKSWQDKLTNDHDLPRTLELNGPAAARWGGRTMVIPAPREVDALMRTVPAGRLVTTNDLRAVLARRHGTEVACPVTTGVFAWIAAHAAVEAAAGGSALRTPFWRTLKAGGELNPKYPGGIPAQIERLEAEGHQIRQKGKRFFVVDHEQRRAELPVAEAAPAAAISVA